MSMPLRQPDCPLYALLRRGEVAEFNRRRAEGETCDLAGADLSRLDLRGLEARGLDLRDAYLRQADVRGVDFRAARLGGASFAEAHVSGCYFPESLSAAELMLALAHGTRLRTLED